jgi:hypothetical protein
MAQYEEPPNQGDPGEPEHQEPPRHKKYEIIVNMVPHKVESDIVSFHEIVKLAGNLPSGPDVEYKITFEKAVKPRHGTMIPGEKVEIKDGTEFVVTPTNRS